MITSAPKRRRHSVIYCHSPPNTAASQTLSHSVAVSLCLSPNTTKTLFYHYIYAYISVCLFICFTKPQISCTWKFIRSFFSLSNMCCLFNALRFYNKSLKQSINIYLVSIAFSVQTWTFLAEEKKRQEYERSHFTLDNKQQLRSDVFLKGNFWSDKLRIVTT